MSHQLVILPSFHPSLLGNPGRKEILTFFYLYIVYTIVEMLLFSGWVPMSSVAYPVRFLWSDREHSPLRTSVVDCRPRRPFDHSILVSDVERFRWLPMGRRRNARLSLGMSSVGS